MTVEATGKDSRPDKPYFEALLIGLRSSAHPAMRGTQCQAEPSSARQRFRRVFTSMSYVFPMYLLRSKHTTEVDGKKMVNRKLDKQK